MATLQIPDGLVEAFINYTVGSSGIALDDEDAIIELITTFAKNTLGLLPCPFERPGQEHNVKIIVGSEFYHVEWRIGGIDSCVGRCYQGVE